MFRPLSRALPRPVAVGAVVLLGCSRTAWGAPCDAAVDVHAAVEAAEARARAEDAPGFEREVEHVVAAIDCAREPIPAALAADVHVTLGLWHWSRREDELALGSMRAARLVHPEHLLPDDLFPDGDPLRAAFQAPAGADPKGIAPSPIGRPIWFDGELTRARPTTRPTIVQVSGTDGRPVLGRVLEPGDRIPAPPWVTATRRGFAIGSGGAAALAIGLYGGAWAERGAFEGVPSDDLPGLERHQRAANGLSVGSIVAAVVALGGGLVAGALR